MFNNPLSRRAFLSTCAAGIGAGAFAHVNFADPETRLHQVSWYNFGTVIEVIVADNDLKKVNNALLNLSQQFHRQNTDWHPWKAGMMGDINDAIQRGESIAIDRHMQQMMLQIQHLYVTSEGSFNPTIGKIVSLWGFHGQQSSGWNPPSTQDIDTLLQQQSSPLDLRIKEGMLHSANPSIQLDLGGYAKGYALNMGVELMKSAGLDNVLINAGGDLKVCGQQGARPWKIGIRDPENQGIIAWVEPEGSESVFTSGNYERYHQKNGVRYTHIINPRTGMPVKEISSATVIHEDAAIADAAATALVVEGASGWRQKAASMGIRKAMVVVENGRVEMIPELYFRTPEV
jgi:thiamine biosynthesis lipoprotein